MARGIAVRAANHARREYLPTYLALRFLFERVDRSSLDDWVAELARTTCLVGRSLGYRHYRIVKGFASGGSIQYRDCYAPSPLALIVEAYVLSMLSEEPAFQPRTENVFSYLWPNRRSGHSYQFFLNGYRQRQEKIGRLLYTQGPKTHSVFVTDIQSFYPTVSPTRALRRFESKLQSTALEKSLPSAFLQVAEQMFEGTAGAGIPIGSALGHTFGHIALSGLDDSLGDAFGSAYLRYVDDIVVVAPNEERTNVEETVKRAVAQEGLALNPEKTYWVSGIDWSDTNLDKDLQQSFEDIKHDLIFFLILHPQSFLELQKALKDNGFNLPLSVFRSMANYSRFRAIFPRALRYLFHRRRWLPSLDQILDSCRQLKAAMWDYYERLRDDATPERSPLDAKLDAQRMKWCLNRLMYLFAPSEYEQILRSMPHGAQFAPYEVLMSALLSKRATEILDFSGPTVASFGQLWTEAFGGSAPRIELKGTISGARLDALATMSAFGMLDEQALRSITFDNNADELLLAFCSSRVPKIRELNDLSYIDEIRSLQLGQQPDCCLRAMTTRFDDDELPYLDALAMSFGGNSY